MLVSFSLLQCVRLHTTATHSISASHYCNTLLQHTTATHSMTATHDYNTLDDCNTLLQHTGYQQHNTATHITSTHSIMAPFSMFASVFRHMLEFRAHSLSLCMYVNTHMCTHTCTCMWWSMIMAHAFNLCVYTHMHTCVCA